MSKARRPLFVAAILLFVAAEAAVLAAENSTDPEDSRLPGPPTTSRGSFIMGRLLTWPDKENEAAGDREDEEANEEPLESDRPDFTESSATVGFRRLQIESGYTFTHAIAGDPTHDAHDLPELLCATVWPNGWSCVSPGMRGWCLIAIGTGFPAALSLRTGAPTWSWASSMR